MPNSRILVVDDDVAVRETVSAMLDEQGYEVVAVGSGAELFREMAGSTPDLLVLDAEMPDGDGYDVLARLKAEEHWRDIPVMMLSSQAPEEAAEKTLGLGAADYIRKPFKPRELIARVQAHLRNRALLRSTRDALRSAEEELHRAREEAESRRNLFEILHEVTGDVSADEIYHILARRVARALSLSRCSVILAKAGDTVGVVATAFDSPVLRNREIDLTMYPEIRTALEQGHPVLVEDLQTNALYTDVRRIWERDNVSVPVRSAIALPFSLNRQRAGVFFLRRMQNEPPLTNDDVEFADAVIKAAVLAIQRAQVIETAKSENARLEVLAHTDPLTQVVNRRALFARIGAELDRVKRYESVMSVLMLDIDHFKDINDTHGHLVGDDVLREVAGLLQTAIRSVDVVARYGGEEFVVVLPETPLAGAVTFAERIRAQIEEHPFCPSVGPLSITVSVGVAAYPGEGVDSIEDLFARADDALYRAKAEGRNAVAV